MEKEVETKNSGTQILSGLPDDLALFCLVRVPRRFHAQLKCVCRRWRDLVSNEDWYLCRRKLNLSETWIYALCIDKYDRNRCYVLDPDSPRRSWKLIAELPPRCWTRKGMGFQAIGKKLYLLGGCGWSEDVTSETYCYDASSNSWTQSVSMSMPRCYFACEVVDGKLCAIGGSSSKLCFPNSCDTYDPISRTWSLDVDDNIIIDVDDSVFFDGKIYLRNGLSAEQSHLLAHEISTGTWQCGDSSMEVGWKGPAVVVENSLYVLDQSSGTRLAMWEKEKREWMSIGRLSPLLTRPPCRIVAIGKKIFVVGKGLRTVVCQPGNMVERILICNYIEGLNSDDSDVINCVCVTL